MPQWAAARRMTLLSAMSKDFQRLQPQADFASVAIRQLPRSNRRADAATCLFVAMTPSFATTLGQF
jgi:hypothetical protein